MSRERTSLHWTIPALGGLQREEVTALVTHKTNSPYTPVYDNEFDPHELFGRVTTSSFESDLHKGNNTSRVWSYSYRPNHSGYRQVGGNYYVTALVDEPQPAPGDTVNFTITADRTDPYEVAGSTAPPIELRVKIELTGGLTVDGTPSYLSTLGPGGITRPKPDSVSYSNSDGVFNIGTQKSSQFTNIVDRRVPTTYSVTLPVTVASDAVVSEQCLTARLTGKPPPGTGPLDDDISDNVAKVCLGVLNEKVVFRDGTTDLLTLFPCVGKTAAPCNTDNTVELAVTVGTAAGKTVDPDAVFQPNNVVIQIEDPAGRAISGSDILWRTGNAVAQTPPGFGILPGVAAKLVLPVATDGYGEHTFAIADATPGAASNPGSVRWKLATSGFTVLDTSDSSKLRFGPQSLTTSEYPTVFEFSALGTYLVNLTFGAEHTASEVDYADTETYTFHVGPIADLGVSDGGASPHVAVGSNALTIVAVNNELETSWEAQVTGLPTGADVLHVTQGAYNSTTGVWDIGELRPRSYYRSGGEPERTLVLSASAGDTARVSIAAENYKVCIGSDASTLTHATQAACEADTTNGGSWHTGPVYDYHTANNTATVTAAAGTGGGDSAPASVTVMDPDASGVLVEWAAVEQVNGLKVTHYELERPSDPWTMNTAPGDVTETKYQDKGATGSANPVYRVRAVNEAGVAGPWSQISGMRPGAPGNFAAAVPTGNTQVNLTWSAPTDVTVTGYELEVSDDDGEPWNWLPAGQTRTALAATALSYDHTGLSLSPGDSRDYRIRTVAGTQRSLWATATATVAYPKPNAPTSFTATGRSATQAELEWVQPADVDDVTFASYELGFSTDGGRMWESLTDTSTKSGMTHTMDHTDSDLGADDVRQYRIRTTGTVGSVTVYSDWAYALASENYPAPGAPRDFTARANSDTSVTLTWTAPEAVAGVNLTGYVLEVSFDRGANWTSVADASTLGSGATTHPHTDANNPLSSKPRQYRLKAVGTVGTSTYESGWVFAVPAGEVGPPRSLTAVPDPDSPTASRTRINLTWDVPGLRRGSGHRLPHRLRPGSLRAVGDAAAQPQQPELPAHRPDAGGAKLLPGGGDLRRRHGSLRRLGLRHHVGQPDGRPAGRAGEPAHRPGRQQLRGSGMGPAQQRRRGGILRMAVQHPHPDRGAPGGHQRAGRQSAVRHDVRVPSAGREQQRIRRLVSARPGDAAPGQRGGKGIPRRTRSGEGRFGQLQREPEPSSSVAHEGVLHLGGRGLPDRIIAIPAGQDSAAHQPSSQQGVLGRHRVGTAGGPVRGAVGHRAGHPDGRLRLPGRRDGGDRL